MLAVSTAGTGALAQTRANSTTMLPVWNSNGQVEGALILEPTDEAAAGARWRMGRNTLSPAFGLDAGESLGLLCNNRNGIGSSISSLITYCNVARLDDDGQNNGQHLSATTSLSRPGGKVGLSLGSGHDTLPAWMTGNGVSPGRFEQNDLAVFGQKNLGREGFVTIGGTVAHAKLVPASELTSIPDQWTSRSLSLGGGYGAFSGSIIGRVVDAPGQPGKWEGLGVGVTWRTPWSGQLTVGAENIVTSGKNPFAPNSPIGDDGTVPYVRYEQDL
ncbi:hypothetical protein EA658_10665 [Pseudoxanthomonas winnipegensis]|uniref:Secreted protein n=2 Tax=Pseudoxanthomonas winnipegensis TaxID=2480810 RepID=A0ABY1WEW3_9GAMM|nr:hypothetical protein [Pseudoxanthomonas winnipegensis]TAA12531.1 hypothetical protein EA659_02985 [Pseudoxanthomonas winnipegensis]TAA19863.1 hypothetical protein EA658_10665 [Pseudoxanthomonas winnipegensis]TAH70620.1 hypothetical protein EA657_17730 [Pseudoxanthomonas winnipegensis]